MASKPARVALAAATATLAAALGIQPADAHKPITSKYTYNEHVYPIFRDRCGACHVEGGVAPMSLLTYEDARPWTESIREELIAERMPPWHVDPVGSAPVALPRSGGALTAREVDTIVVWATGGTPEGDPSKRPAPAVSVGSEWRAGTPDATITMPAPATVPADRQDDTREFVLATGIADTRWLKGVDLLPGTPSMVHDAVIGIEGGQELAVWTPGDSPTMLPAGAAVRLEAGRKLTLRIHYKKSWRDERTARSDRSTIGLYFAAPPAGGREVRIMQADAAPTTQPLTLLGIRPMIDRVYASVDVEARVPSGEHVHLLRLRNAQPDWPRRYMLLKPIELPAGTKIEVSADPRPPQGRLAVALIGT
jgi:hypothetical protein